MSKHAFSFKTALEWNNLSMNTSTHYVALRICYYFSFVCTYKEFHSGLAQLLMYIQKMREGHKIEDGEACINMCPLMIQLSSTISVNLTL